ncbi:MAG: VOC family protein [Phyllobacteriaceae bacterium]|nr:VOC family protein [Phyllobacteriaceae bacterium]
MTGKVRTCLWMNNQGEEAANFYVALIPDSRIETVGRYPEGSEHGTPGSAMVVDFTLAGTPYQILNGGPMFPLSEAVSISVRTKDQAETDRLWAALIADGGAESQCGWLKDRFGLSWQIVPEPAIALLSGPKASKVWPALMRMRKIDIAALEKAAAA